MQLTTKYRCTSYEEILGNVVEINALTAYHKVGAFPKVTVFYGPHGTGKTSASNIAMKTILCQNKTPDGLACNVCPSCRAVDEYLIGKESVCSGLNYNVIDFSAKGDDKEYISQVISTLKNNICGTTNMPYVVKFEEMHKVSLSDQAMFDKTLENLPENVYVIINMNDISNLLEGILQRCTLKLHFKCPNDAEVLAYTKMICAREGIKMKVEGMRKLINIKGCNVRNILQSLDVIGTIGDAGKELELEMPVEYTTYIDYFVALKLGYGPLLDFIDKLPSKIQFINNFNSFLKLALRVKERQRADIPKALRDSIIKEVLPFSKDILFKLISCIAGLELNKNLTNNIAEDYILAMAYELNASLMTHLELTEEQETGLVAPTKKETDPLEGDIDMAQLIEGVNDDGTFSSELMDKLQQKKSKEVTPQRKQDEDTYTSPFSANAWATPISKNKKEEKVFIEDINDVLSHEKTGRGSVSDL